MDIIEVKIKSKTTIRVIVESNGYPQSIAGVIWKYDPSDNPLGSAGKFTTDTQSVVLGHSDDIDQHTFLVEGVVNHMNDNPPTPYQVNVVIEEDSKQIKSEIPSQGGSGKISDANQAFTYAFKLTI